MSSFTFTEGAVVVMPDGITYIVGEVKPRYQMYGKQRISVRLDAKYRPSVWIDIMTPIV